LRKTQEKGTEEPVERVRTRYHEKIKTTAKNVSNPDKNVKRTLKNAI
jgi:hypothetical protein